VLHYDVAYTSENCFRILHNVRGLSVHFMLDLDGTIYQTCDLRERARQASIANDRSIGIEIAHPGPLTGQPRLVKRYKQDEEGVVLEVPEFVPLGALTSRRWRPARPELIHGRVQGQQLAQYDFTAAQYEALTSLLAALHRVLPRIRLDAPRSEDGAIIWRALSPAELFAFEGVIGHYHVTTKKIDPGPAFDWERLFTGARAKLGAGVPSRTLAD
jgi:N-acetyl-anhydromuramyl-L-alanine amidase AmpD